MRYSLQPTLLVYRIVYLLLVCVEVIVFVGVVKSIM